jgi:hypothetical protein
MQQLLYLHILEAWIMSTSSPVHAQTLGQPGAGLPAVEAFMARHVVFPLTCWLTSRTKAIEQVVTVGHNALKTAQTLPEASLHQPVLINRFMGIEHSSRHWSVLMTLQHLLITGNNMASIVEHLTHGQPYPTEVRIENVKPQTALDAHRY